MKASELKIGNWINHKYSPPSFIVSVINTFNENTVNGIELEDCEPIPLTEEWLLKFGFKKQGEWFCNNDLNVSIIHSKTTFGCNEEYHIPNIDHVHQLQNLYFALTGGELCTNQP